ncbi:helix-turn-helix transcriptional regulator [Limosilactobacillus reuteri]|uniref:helix-turn-helix transcriptional regulator n=1 Tax=Limosilactobacillus reuteri TaxID=1598 RepID=UPI0021CE44EB|nr:helix-turn-helix transcriptional regulator [Limosilactobacillus reuteri]MCU4692089.1 helix-turn-helix transcriptional regulator [Limosilactobacillus reuteri]
MAEDKKLPQNRIAELRKNKKLSQAQLAKETGLTRQAVSLYEIGKREPKLETWIKLADFFDVSVLYLQGLSNSKVTFNSIDKFIKSNGFDMSALNSSLNDKDIHTYKRLTDAYHGRKEPNSKINPKKMSLLYRDLMLENNISDSQKFIEFTRLFARIYHLFLMGYGEGDDKARKLYEKILAEVLNSSTASNRD